MISREPLAKCTCTVARDNAQAALPNAQHVNDHRPSAARVLEWDLMVKKDEREPDPGSSRLTAAGSTVGVAPAAAAAPHSADDAGLILAELEDRFALDVWAFVDGPLSDAAFVDRFLGACLMHVCLLLQRIADENMPEVARRVLARAHFESVLVLLFVHFGGHPALDEVLRDEAHSWHQWAAAVERHNATVRSRRQEIAKRNRRIAATNAHLTRYNDEHHDNPKPLLAALGPPTGEIMDFDVRPALARFDHLVPAALPLAQIAERLGPMLQASGDGGDFMSMYDTAFRSLSKFGVHATPHMIAGYVQTRGGNAWIHRISRLYSAPSMFPGFSSAATFLTAYCSAKVLSRRGDSPPHVARAIYKRLQSEARSATGV